MDVRPIGKDHPGAEVGGISVRTATPTRYRRIHYRLSVIGEKPF
jgi:hypothetical protein